MVGSSRPRVLSLDLGETVYWDTPEIAHAQVEVRVQVLAAGLLGADGGPLDPPTVAQARARVLDRWKTQGLFASSLPNTHMVTEVQQELRARLRQPLEDLAARYSDAGLDEHPPHLNPEAQELVRTMMDRGIPVVAVTNTSRSGRSWADFLLRKGGLRFEFIAASCDQSIRKPDPRIFRSAARKVHVEPSEVVHVGDRWDRDVEGAQGAGMSAALYRGLWSRYWNMEEGPPVLPPADTKVPCFDRLTEARRLLLGP